MNINFITTHDQYESFLDSFDAHKICLDFETTGLQANLARARLLQICDASPDALDRTVHVLDLFKCDHDERLKSFIESREMLIIHNANFDIQFLLSLGIDYKNKIFCTYLAERVLRAGFKDKKVSPQAGNVYFDDISCSLKAILERRFDIKISKEKQVSDWNKDELDIEQIEYAAKDVDVLPRLAFEQIEELREENLLSIYSLESKCIRAVARMCFKGFAVDITKLKELKASIEQTVNEKTQEFVKELDDRLPEGQKLPRGEDGNIAIGKKAGKQFNPGSTKQVIDCFNLIGVELPIDGRTEKQTLNQISLSEFDSDDTTLRLYRERTKIETRLEHATKLIDNIHPITHRIHSGYNQYGANSGRFTSSGAKRVAKTKKKETFGINVQQVPRTKDFRECFVASEGKKLIICDWAQIELRLGAELINIPQMKKAFNDGIDLHTLTASLIYKVSIEDVTKEQRQDGKTLNFALLYGMGFRKYKTYAAQSGKIISLSEAKVAHAGFHSAYPRLREWHRERAALVSDGWAYVRTALGRRRLLSFNDASMMVSANTLIQGSGADILKIAIANLDEHLNDDVNLVAAVHDELVLEVPEKEAEKFRTILEQAMIQAAEKVLFSVPAEADASIGDNWSAK